MTIDQVPSEVLRDFLIPCLSVQDITRVDDAACSNAFRSNYLAALRHSDLPQLRKTIIGPRHIYWVIKREVSLSHLHFSSACDETVIDSIPHSSCHALKKITIPRLRNATKRSIDDLCLRSPVLTCVVISTNENIWQLLCEFPQLTHVIAPAACVSRDVGVMPITSLRQLTICESRVTDECIADIARVCPDLRHLNISSCCHITNAALLSLSDHCHALRILHLARCFHITCSGIIALSNGCSELEELNLSVLGIGNIALEAVAERCRGLKKLTLDKCKNITDEGIVSIATSCPNIEYLSLVKVGVTDTCLLMIGAKCLNLDTIHLSDCILITSSGINHLSQCVHLREVYLNRCVHICDTALAALSACSYLQKVELASCNRITSDGVYQFIRQHSSLRYLSVRGCYALCPRLIPDLTDMELMPLLHLKCIGCQFSRRDLSKMKEKHPDLFLQAV